MNVSRYALDMAERAASTFGEAFIVYLGAHFSVGAVQHVAIWQGALGAGGAAVAALGKGLVAGRVGDTNSAAFLPAAAGGAAGAAVGGAVGTAVGDVVSGAGQAVGNVVTDVTKAVEGSQPQSGQSQPPTGGPA